MANLNFEAVRKVVLAGFIGELFFETYAWLVSPVLFGPTLEPARLVTEIVDRVTGVSLPYGPAFAIHSFVGAVIFAFLVFFAQKITHRSYVMTGFVTGLILWFVAQGILAPFVGRSFMMDFGTYTQSSFVAHTCMLVVIGFVLSKVFAPEAAAEAA